MALNEQLSSSKLVHPNRHRRRTLKLRDIRETEGKEGDEESGKKGILEEEEAWKQAGEYAERKDKEKYDEQRWAKNGVENMKAPKSAVQQMYESKLRYARSVQV